MNNVITKSSTSSSFSLFKSLISEYTSSKLLFQNTVNKPELITQSLIYYNKFYKHNYPKEDFELINLFNHDNTSLGYQDFKSFGLLLLTASRLNQSTGLNSILSDIYSHNNRISKFVLSTGPQTKNRHYASVKFLFKKNRLKYIVLLSNNHLRELLYLTITYANTNALSNIWSNEISNINFKSMQISPSKLLIPIGVQIQALQIIKDDINTWLHVAEDTPNEFKSIISSREISLKNITKFEQPITSCLQKNTKIFVPKYMESAVIVSAFESLITKFPQSLLSFIKLADQFRKNTGVKIPFENLSSIYYRQLSRQFAYTGQSQSFDQLGKRTANIILYLQDINTQLINAIDENNSEYTDENIIDAVKIWISYQIALVGQDRFRFDKIGKTILDLFSKVPKEKLPLFLNQQTFDTFLKGTLCSNHTSGVVYLLFLLLQTLSREFKDSWKIESKHIFWAIKGTLTNIDKNDQDYYQLISPVVYYLDQQYALFGQLSPEISNLLYFHCLQAPQSPFSLAIQEVIFTHIEGKEYSSDFEELYLHKNIQSHIMRGLEYEYNSKNMYHLKLSIKNVLDKLKIHDPILSHQL